MMNLLRGLIYFIVLVLIQGLPERPSGKTRLKITLLVEEDGGLVKGNVEDLGFGNEIAPSGFKQDFDPDRFKNTVVGER